MLRHDLLVSRDDLSEFVDELVNARRWCTGIQVSVRSPKLELDIARGSHLPGVPTQIDTLFSVACATRPVLAMGVGLLADHNILDLEVPVGMLVPETSVFHGIDAPLIAVLNHSLPLAAPSLIEVNLTPVLRRRELVIQGLRLARRGYSEYTSQVLLAEVVESVAKMPARVFLHEQVLPALGLERDIRFGFTGLELLECWERIGTYVWGLPERAVPVLGDRSPHQACQDRVALGGYASAAALARLYEMIGAMLCGDHVPGLPRAEVVSRLWAEHRADDGGPYAAGFMVNLPEHGYGASLSAESLGHTGALGTAVAWYEPRDRTAAAVLLNGVSDPPSAVAEVRSDLIHLITSAGRVGS